MLIVAIGGREGLTTQEEVKEIRRRRSPCRRFKAEQEEARRIRLKLDSITIWSMVYMFGVCATL